MYANFFLFSPTLQFQMLQPVKFSRKNNADFVKELKANVNNYFKENKISKFGNYKMVVKSIFMLTLYLTPYCVILFTENNNVWLHLCMWAIMGLGMSGIGLSIMHDANHGSYSKNALVNKLMSSVIYMVGGNSLNWKIQHNVLHHTYTNIEGLDEDIEAPVVALRFSPHQPKKKIQKYQHLYAWIFYGFLTLTWAFDADFKQMVGFKKKGLIKGQNKSFGRIMFDLVFFKLLYYVFIFVLPITLSVAPWWISIVGFFVMQFIAGLVLASIFQPAHVVPDTEYPLPDDNGNMESSWLVHQLQTTTNFAQKNKAFTWFVGGLNHQVEHHLFPTICHIHYPKISAIVKETALAYNLPYHSYPKFTNALYNHAKLLKQFGQ